MQRFAGLLLAGLMGAQVGVAEARAPAEAYSLRGNFRSVEISPDGTHIAMLAQQVGQSIVTISKVGGSTCRVGAGGNNLLGLSWASDDRLVVVAQRMAEARIEGADRLINVGQSFSVGVTCGDIRKLNGSGIVGLTSDNQILMTAPAVNASAPGEQLTRRWRKGSFIVFDLYKVDPRTGTGVLVERGGENTFDYLADRDGAPRLRFDVDPGSSKLMTYARIGDSKAWQLVHDERTSTSNDNAYSFIELGPEPDTAYVLTRNGGDRFGIHVFSFRERRIVRPAFERKDADATGFVSGYVNGRFVPVGVAYQGDDDAVDFLDPVYARIHDDLRDSFPGEEIELASVTRDGKGVIALVDGPTNPGGVYYYIDMAQGEIVELVKQRPRLTMADVGPVKFYRYAARDGYSVPAYLTLPNGSTGRNLPLVVLPHGGPEARDYDGFDSWTQFLASRGYAVMQPQFRGSDGFGKAHRDAGRQQWGLRMQDDITDGVKDLIAKGVVDPKRVCIVGWSYGGYATLAGLTVTPELYRCGVAGAPVSDIPRMLDWWAKNGGRWIRSDDEIVKMIGDPKADYDRLARTSPARNADKVRAPLMIVHPRLDNTVPLEQAQIMADAMKAAGKPHELRVIDGDDHNLKRESTGVEFLNILENFLGQNLK